MRSPTYNEFAGASLDRLAALSDGVFAFAMTVLVLNLRQPAASIQRESDLWNALVTLWPSLVTYLMSFLTLGIFWVGQQTQLNHMARGTRSLAWLHLGFLLMVTLMPFSTSLLAGHITLKIALVVYWLNIALLGAMLFATWRYAERKNLLKSEVTPPMRAAVVRRIAIAQALYAFGALLCLIDPWVSVAFIVLVQLNYAIAPRIGVLNRM